MNIRKKVSWPKEPKKKTVKSRKAHKPSKKAAPKYEVLTDGKTVWVNNPICVVARFCKRSCEYADSFGFVTTLPFDKLGPTNDDWLNFVLIVKLRFGIRIEDKYRPDYIARPKLTKAEWALLEVTESISTGDDLYHLTGMSVVEGDAILSYVARLKAEHGVEWKNSDYVDMMSNPD